MKFERSKFQYDGLYLKYDGRFVARFKYSAAKARKPRFVTFLIKHFEVEEYFAALEANHAPLTILEAKGFDSLGPAMRARIEANAARIAAATVANVRTLASAVA